MNNAAVNLAYRHCEQITRARAANFYYGIRLLPPAKRAAMCALYAMARRIDDVGDGDASGSHDDRLEALEAIKASVKLLEGPAPSGHGGASGALPPPGDPVLIALADANARFNLPLDAFGELVEGCQWDLEGRRYETFPELVEYCRRVAGTIGRLSLAVYQPADYQAAAPLADALGVALQLTNILRDLLEDLGMGRVYLPLEDLRRFDVSPNLEGDHENLLALVCFESGRAWDWYEEGLGLLGLLDRRSRACTAAMAGIYHRLLERIRSHPGSVLQERVCLSAGEKLQVAALSLARGAA